MPLYLPNGFPYISAACRVDDNIGKSKRILTNMSRRMRLNKWLISSIIAVLVIAVAMILYFKLK
jgi:vesicle transport through interaction with t-SNAREs protein 1